MVTIELKSLKLSLPGIREPRLAHQLGWIRVDGHARLVTFVSTDAMDNYCFQFAFNPQGDPDNPATVKDMIPFQTGVIYNRFRWNGEHLFGLAGRIDSEVSFVEVWDNHEQKTLTWIELERQFVHNLEWLGPTRFACSFLGSNRLVKGEAGKATLTSIFQGNEPLASAISILAHPKWKTLFYVTQSSVFMLRPDLGSRVLLFRLEAKHEHFTHVQLDPDYNVLFALTNRGVLYLVDPKARALVDRVEIFPRDPVHFLFHPRGYLAVFTKSQEVRVVHIEDYHVECARHVRLPVDIPLATPIDIAWHPDGSRLVGIYMHMPKILLDISLGELE